MESQHIGAGWETLMRQAPITVSRYLVAAVESIDETFGNGYAERHPQLVGAFIQSCALDFHAATVGVKIQHLVSAIEHFPVPEG